MHPAECAGTVPHGPHHFNGGAWCPGLGELAEGSEYALGQLDAFRIVRSRLAARDGDDPQDAAAYLRLDEVIARLEAGLS